MYPIWSQQNKQSELLFQSIITESCTNFHCMAYKYTPDLWSSRDDYIPSSLKHYKCFESTITLSQIMKPMEMWHLPTHKINILDWWKTIIEGFLYQWHKILYFPLKIGHMSCSHSPCPTQLYPMWASHSGIRKDEFGDPLQYL